MDIHKLLDEEDSLKRFGLLVERDLQGNIRANVPHVHHHSPTGYECGYAGAGPADLALAVMHALIPPISEESEAKLYTLEGDAFYNAIANPANHVSKLGPNETRVSDVAYLLHQRFKIDHIVGMSKEGGFVPIATILDWIEANAKTIRGGSASLQPTV